MDIKIEKLLENSHNSNPFFNHKRHSPTIPIITNKKDVVNNTTSWFTQLY